MPTFIVRLARSPCGLKLGNASLLHCFTVQYMSGKVRGIQQEIELKGVYRVLVCADHIILDGCDTSLTQGETMSLGAVENGVLSTACWN